MSDVFTQAVQRLSHVPGVRGALVVDLSAGVPVVEELTQDVSGTAVAALAGAMFRRTAQASESAGFGDLDTIHLEADAGHVLVAGAGDLIIVALLADDAQIGKVRIEARRAAAAVLGETERAF